MYFTLLLTTMMIIGDGLILFDPAVCRCYRSPVLLQKWLLKCCPLLCWWLTTVHVVCQSNHVCITGNDTNYCISVILLVAILFVVLLLYVLCKSSYDGCIIVCVCVSMSVIPSGAFCRAWTRSLQVTRHDAACIRRHLGTRNDMPFPSPESYTLLFLFFSIGRFLGTCPACPLPCTPVQALKHFQYWLLLLICIVCDCDL